MARKKTKTDEYEQLEPVGIVEPRMSIGFVLRMPTYAVSTVSDAIGRTLSEHPSVEVIYRKSSVGRLWIMEESPLRG